MRKADRHAAEFARFILVGICNTALTYGLYLGLMRVTGYMLAYSVSYLAGIFISYILNSLFVFEAALSRKTALSFPLLYVFQYIWGCALLWLLVQMFGFDKKIAVIFVIVSNALLTFVLMKKLFRAKWLR